MNTLENLKKEVASVDIKNREEILNFKEKKELNFYLDKRIYQITNHIEDLEGKERTDLEENLLIIRKLEYKMLNKNIETLQKLMNDEI